MDVISTKRFADTRESECKRTQPAFQFSILTLFCVTTLCAAMAWVWPPRDFPIELHAALLISLIGFVAMVLCGQSAWRVMTVGRQSRRGRLDLPEAETFVFLVGVSGLIPIGLNLLIAIWLDFFHDTSVMQFALWVIRVYLPPMLLVLCLSFWPFLGIRRNPALFAMRIVGLLANITWPALALTFIARTLP